MATLYKIEVNHVGVRSSHKSLQAYITAENDEEVYEIIKAEKIQGVCCAWAYQEMDNVTIDDEPFKDRVIRLKGDINDDYNYKNDVPGLFYGWVNMGPVTPIQLDVLIQLGILGNWFYKTWTGAGNLKVSYPSFYGRFNPEL